MLVYSSIQSIQQQKQHTFLTQELDSKLVTRWKPIDKE